MITVLMGDNSFEVREALKRLETAFDGRPERIDGSAIELRNIPDLLMGGTLFAEKRLVIISGLSTNSSIWEKLPDWLPRVSDDIQLVLIDAKPDKRTTSYKALKAAADVQEFPAWTDRDYQKAESWLFARAKEQGLVLERKVVQHIVHRVGLDQWQLASAIDTLLLLDEVTIEAVNRVTVPNPTENVFQLFEIALEGNKKELREILQTLEVQEDPYALFALLSSQAFSLAAITYAEADVQPTKDFAIHPFVASKLARHAKRLGKTKVARMMNLFAKTDADMKRSRAEPWLLIEKLLFSIQE